MHSAPASDNFYMQHYEKLLWARKREPRLIGLFCRSSVCASGRCGGSGVTGYVSALASHLCLAPTTYRPYGIFHGQMINVYYQKSK